MPLPLIAGLAEIGLAIGGIKSIAGSAIGVAKALGGLPWKLEQFGDGLLEGKEALRMYSGQINQAFAKLEVGGMLIKSGQARATAGSTAGLVDGVLDLKRTLAPWQAIFTNGFNKLATIVVGGLTSVLKAMEEIPGIGDNIRRMREEMEKSDEIPNHSVQFLNDIAAGRLSGRVTDRIQVGGMPAFGRRKDL